MYFSLICVCVCVHGKSILDFAALMNDDGHYILCVSCIYYNNISEILFLFA